MRRYPAKDEDVVEKYCNFCKKETEQIILWIWNSDISQITKYLCLECVQEDEEVRVIYSCLDLEGGG